MQHFLFRFFEIFLNIHCRWIQNLRKKHPDIGSLHLHFESFPGSLQILLEPFFSKNCFKKFLLIFEKQKLTLETDKGIFSPLKIDCFLGKKMEIEIKTSKEIPIQKFTIGRRLNNEQKENWINCHDFFSKAFPKKNNGNFNTLPPLKSLENIWSQKFFGLFTKGLFFLVRNFRKRTLIDFPNFFKKEINPHTLIVLGNLVKQPQCLPYILGSRFSNISGCFKNRILQKSSSLKKGIYRFLISTNLGFNGFFFSDYKIVFVDPSCSVITFYQLLKKFSNKYILNRIRPNSALNRKEIFELQLKLLGEKGISRSFEIQNILFKTKLEKNSKFSFGTIYKIKNFLCNLSDIKFGFSSLVFSDSIFFSTRGVFISLDKNSPRSLKKTVFFSGKIPTKKNFIKKRKLLKKIIEKFEIFSQKNLFKQEIGEKNLRTREKAHQALIPNARSLPFFSSIKCTPIEVFLKWFNKFFFFRKKNSYLIFESKIIKKIKILQLKTSFFLSIEFFPNYLLGKNRTKTFSSVEKIFFELKGKQNIFSIFKKLKAFKISGRRFKRAFFFGEHQISKRNYFFNFPNLNNLKVTPSLGGDKKALVSLRILPEGLFFSDSEKKNQKKIEFKFLKEIYFEENTKSGRFQIVLVFLESVEFLNQKRKSRVQFYFENHVKMEKLIKKKKTLNDESNSEEDCFENLKNEKISKNFQLFIFFLRKISGLEIQKINEFFGFWGIKNKKNSFFFITKNSLFNFDLSPSFLVNFRDLEMIYLERSFSGTKTFDLVLILHQNEKNFVKNNFSWVRILSVENRYFRCFEKLSKIHGLKFLNGSLNINWNLVLKLIPIEYETINSKNYWQVLVNKNDQDYSTDETDEIFCPDNLELSDSFKFDVSNEKKEKEEGLDWEDLIKGIE